MIRTISFRIWKPLLAIILWNNSKLYIDLKYWTVLDRFWGQSCMRVSIFKMELLLGTLLFLLPPTLTPKSVAPFHFYLLQPISFRRWFVTSQELLPFMGTVGWFGNTIAYSSQHSSVEFLTARACWERPLLVVNSLHILDGWMGKVFEMILIEFCFLLLGCWL